MPLLLPYIVATAALGTGIDVPGVLHIIHLEAPASIVDYAQEAGRAGRAGERVRAEIVVEERDWPVEDPAKDSCLELKTREVNAFVRTQACRRRLLGQCLDGDLRDCKALKAVPCDNCSQAKLLHTSELTDQGLVMSRAHGRETSRALQRIEAALEEIEGLGKLACRICWMFNGAKEARHRWVNCPELDEAVTFGSCMAFQGKVKYRKETHARFLSCFYCHVTQELCTDGYQNQGATCRWKHIVLPLALAATSEPPLWTRLRGIAGRDFRGMSDYQDWLGHKHHRLVGGREMTNAMAVFSLILEWRTEQGLSVQ